MKNKSLIYLFLSIAALSSCEQNIISTKAEILSEYKGDYEIVFMDWTTDEKNINTVDLDNNGTGTNDLMAEISGISDRPIRKSRIAQKNERGTLSERGTLFFYLPVVDYYTDPGIEGFLSTNSVADVEIPLHLTVTDQGVVESDLFTLLDWPDENRIGLKNLSDIKIIKASPDRIDIEVGHYLVYDYATQKLIDGSVKVWLTRM